MGSSAARPAIAADARAKAAGFGMCKKNAEMNAEIRPNKASPYNPPGVAARQILHHADIPRPEEPAEIAERVDPRDRAGGRVPVRNIGGIDQNGPLEP